MWTPTTRRQHSRDGLRYETDLTDAEWAVIEPLLPKACGRGRTRTCLREVLNAIFYVLRGGITWRLIPSDLPPKSTVFGWFSLWRDTGLFETINHLLVMADRERVGREASPSAAVIDSQSVKTTESGGSWWTRTGAASFWSPSPPTFRIGAERPSCFACRGARSRSLRKPLPTQAMPGTDRRGRPASP